MLLLHLHPAEAEAIALAVDLHAGLVLIDEQEGRQYAAQAEISVSGALGVLLRAKLDGTIQALKPKIELLRSKTRFFVAPSLEAIVLAAAGEETRQAKKIDRRNRKDLTNPFTAPIRES
jgi:predicted nucleic acid-binding protein